MISDSLIFAALGAVTAWRRSEEVKDNVLDYRLSDVREHHGQVDLRLEQRDGLSARLLVGLPSSGAPQYWLYAPPTDANDWVEQLLIWIDEEVFTSGLVSGRVRELHGGESYVVIANYGWQVSDPMEHARLASAAGPPEWLRNDHT